MAYQYKNKLIWTENKKGRLDIEGKPSLQISTPEEFGGEKGYLSPEDLFVASVNSCLMTTFLYFADKKKVKIKSYTSEAIGTLSKGLKGFCFSEIEIKIEVSAEDNEVQKKIPELIELAKRYCLISNSIKSKVKLIY